MPAWNSCSVSLKSALAFAPPEIQLRPRRDVTRNPLEKTVSAPHPNADITRKHHVHKDPLTSSIFAAPAVSPVRSVTPTRAAWMHTNPFDGARQSPMRPMYHSYGGMPHKEPHAMGKCHLQPPEKSPRGFSSVSGAVSYGGKRHSNAQAAETSNKPTPRSPMRRSLATRSVSPISMDIVTPQPTVSPLRKRSPMRSEPSLLGTELGKPVRLAMPPPCTSVAPWNQEPKSKSPMRARSPLHSAAMSGSTTTTTTSKVGTPTAACAPPVAVVPKYQVLQPWSKGNAPKEPKQLTTNKVRAPFHTDTPRMPPSNAARKVSAPFHTMND